MPDQENIEPMDVEDVRVEDGHYPKSERLRHKVLVDALFEEGKSLYEYPLRLTYRALSASELASSFRMGVPDKIAPLQMLVTIPKKRRRHAVDRVLMRRRIREIWRRKRRPLRRVVEENPDIRTLSIGIVYMANENFPSAKLERKIDTLLSKLLTHVAESREPRVES